MSTLSSGHAKNVASIAQLNQVITALGTTYNPGNPTLALAALTTLQSGAVGKLNDVNAAFTTWKDVTNQREITFQDLNKFCRRILGAFQSSPASDQAKDDTKALIDAIASGAKLTKADAGRSGGAGNPPAPGTGGQPPVPGADDENEFTRHNGYTERVNLFGQLVTLLQGQTDYAPNELDITIAKLQGKLADLQTANTSVLAAEVVLKSARASRNIYFYKQGTGLLDIVKQVKAYVKSMQGSNSQLYKSVREIRFVRVVQSKNAN